MKNLLYQDPTLKSEIVDLHTSLGTQLEDSGLILDSILHFKYASDIDENDYSLKVKKILSVPIIYDTEDELGEDCFQEKV